MSSDSDSDELAEVEAELVSFVFLLVEFITKLDNWLYFPVN